MRIPLDYYRILGLPIQATAEQLQQAHRDRALQLPRRGYSEAAIAARRQLIDEAYAVLSDPEQRRAYDANFLAKPPSADDDLEQSESATDELWPNTPGHTNPNLKTFRELSLLLPELSTQGSSGTPSQPPQTATTASTNSYIPNIEIREEQFIGALLILLELGEYELVLKLSRSYLHRHTSFKSSIPGELEPVEADIILTAALACLELGREQWQQGQYENAAVSLEIGQDLLLREGLFVSIRGEIQADLYKLRPYRILELLALPEASGLDRRQGLQLLRDMLQERGGIDGTGNDQSGLSIDDFLRFIQQLRSYLTAEEQHILFEEEARRPSAVATYLAVYALIARGFAQYHPALIRRAKGMLSRLASRQDVYLEQAVCALLLGQTDEASQALELSHEYEPLAFIKEHSQGSPDLLPGLCLYSERWLQEEVFPHFRDLAQRQVMLRDYFADEQVQAYLEELPSNPTTASDWTMPPPPTKPYRDSPDRNINGSTANSSNTFNRRNTLPNRVDTGSRQSSRPDTSSYSVPDRNISPPERPTTSSEARPSNPSPTGTRQKRYTAPRREETARRSLEPSQNGVRSRTQPEPNSLRNAAVETSSPASTELGTSEIPAERLSNDIELPPRRSKQRSLKVKQLLILGGIGLIGLGSLGFLATKTYGWLTQAFRGSSGPTLQEEQPMVQLARPPVAIPPKSAPAQVGEGALNKQSAKRLVDAWLAAKASALGPNYAVEALNQVLVDPTLTQWQKRALEAKREDWYWQYKHRSQVSSVEVDAVDSNQAKVDAEVNEIAELFEDGQLNQYSSYDKNLRVRYILVRKEGRWRIKEIEVLQ